MSLPDVELPHEALLDDHLAPHGGRSWARHDKIDWFRVYDSCVTEEVVRRVGSLRRPWFLSVNTIENHMPYDAEKYHGASPGIRFTRPISDRSKEALTAYAYGARNADRAPAGVICRADP